MKCPYCGSLNVDQAKSCHRCNRRFLSADREPEKKPVAAPEPTDKREPVRKIAIDPMANAKSMADKIANQLKFDYSTSKRGEDTRVREGLERLLTFIRESGGSTRLLLQEVAEMIYRTFVISQVAIGLRDSKSGIFRYEVMAGMRKEAEKALKNTTYAQDEFFDTSVWKGISISKFTKIYLAEYQPFQNDEEATYNRPMLLKHERKTMNECHEADYLDVLMYGKNRELVGWIEISGTREGKLPDATTIKWIELVGSITALAVQYDRSLRMRA